MSKMDLIWKVLDIYVHKYSENLSFELAVFGT